MNRSDQRKAEVIAKVPINSLPPGGGGLGWGGACREIRMLQIHPPPNPLPSREGEHILKSFAITSEDKKEGSIIFRRNPEKYDMEERKMFRGVKKAQ